MLRRFRDQQSETLQPSALASVFTPIRGMLTFATEEKIITTNPVLIVKMPKDKRSVHERKWVPFPPKEMKRLLDAMEDYWGKPMRGLSDERRKAIHMVCRCGTLHNLAIFRYPSVENIEQIPPVGGQK